MKDHVKEFENSFLSEMRRTLRFKFLYFPYYKWKIHNTIFTDIFNIDYAQCVAVNKSVKAQYTYYFKISQNVHLDINFECLQNNFIVTLAN